MNRDDLIELVNIEFNYLDSTIASINELNDIIGRNQPDKFQMAAISKLMCDVYNGTENILKRFCKFLKIPIPSGGYSHTNLLLLFNNPANKNLPQFFDNDIFDDYKALLKFRHYVIHGYAFHLEWNIIKSSVIKIESIEKHFKENVFSFINSLK
ncbi:MAG: hypothetical protein ABSG15_03515 [FCB group bacterium]|jgi:hypothetical protein